MPDELHPTTGAINPDCERADWWREAFGGLEVPLVSPVAQLWLVPGVDGVEGEHLVYQVDVSKLGGDQIDRVARVVAAQFDLDVASVRADIEREGIPILAEDVVVSFDARWL
jgi:hypothetical protein